MASEFKLMDIYEQNLNFLIGAGASYGFLPTLALEVIDEAGNKCTFIADIYILIVGHEIHIHLLF